MTFPASTVFGAPAAPVPGFPGIVSGAAEIGPAAAGLAPRRHLLTKTMGSGLFTAAIPSTTTTFLQVIPIEAPCYAVRLGFANCFNVSMAIASAGVYPSDSYSVLTANGNAALLDNAHNTQYFPVPTGSAPESKIYFDGAGAFNTTINTAGTTRGLTLPAVTANTGNAAEAFTVQWSDLVPCTSIHRADGGTQHLLFVYVTLSAGNLVGPNAPNVPVMNSNALASRGGRYFWTGLAWNGGTDYTDNPTGTGFKSFGIIPTFAIQYLTANPGIQTVVVGDSLSAAPTNDSFTTPLMRAGWDLSTPSMPIEYASMAWGGTTSPVYDVMLSNNQAALRPSIIAHQPLSRNDGFAAATMQMLLAKSLGLADANGYAYGTRTLFNIAGLEPSADGNQTSIAAFNDMRGRLLAVASASGVPLIDAATAVGNIAGGAPWDYLPGFSDDNTHLNYAGTEAIVPQATRALRQLIGI